eukprot:TRINITY_DN18792_c0_g1_i1.p1 TRINITY_DN18792_c0_g1~~TRINITY_DN18792_c0_g1_i1.p1  ORF type:complete len:114 (+),score=20.04 TRINITY_DN18792_c0_g1_i1:64-405(+)
MCIRDSTWCAFNHCAQCFSRNHPGYTCEEFVQDTDKEFDVYATTNGVRKCPNHKCKANLMKVDGCNKVLCSLCKHAVCWKCMEYFATPTDCYNHLNKVHGGYNDPPANNNNGP